jgi:pimeloyl-ACP methyl ester carboxylesterase
MKVSSAWLQRLETPSDQNESQSGLAQLSHYSATYREWGEGPPLILLPGLAGGIGLVTPLARLLARSFRVISYQLRGEENCFDLRRRVELKDLVQDLHEFIEWRGLERPDVLGLSFGGVIGLEFAARYSHRLNSLTVQGVGARFDRNLLKIVAGMVLSGYPLPANNSFINQFFHLLFGRGPQPRERIEFVTRQCWQTDQCTMAHRFRLVRKLDLRPRLSKIRTPVMIITGARDVVVSDKSVLDLCSGIEDARFVRLHNGGHLAFLVEPERVCREVATFAYGCCVA